MINYNKEIILYEFYIINKLSNKQIIFLKTNYI